MSLLMLAMVSFMYLMFCSTSIWGPRGSLALNKWCMYAQDHGPMPSLYLRWEREKERDRERERSVVSGSGR